MKKFLFILLLLIILCGAGFFFGWAQLTVPPGSYGVMRSKTNGLESQVIRDGEFRWYWYKLIPTNVKISVYTLGPVNYSFDSSGSLSSGEVYASVAGINTDFSWRISGNLSFSLKPDTLPDFTGRENISDDAGLRKAEGALAERIGSFAIQRLKSYADSDDGTKVDTLAFTGSLSELNNDIAAAFPEIENLNCTVQVVHSPDYKLYQSLKELYTDYLAHQSSVLKPDVITESENRISLRSRIDELTSYGELLTKYPILLQYLAIEKGLQPDK